MCSHRAAIIECLKVGAARWGHCMTAVPTCSVIVAQHWQGTVRRAAGAQSAGASASTGRCGPFVALWERAHALRLLSPTGNHAP